MSEIEKLDTITLNNIDKYIVIEKLIVNDKNYLYLCKIDDDEELTDEYIIVSEAKKGSNYGVKRITDNDELLLIRDMFLNLLEKNYG